MNNKMGSSKSQTKASVIKALAHPVRLALVEMLDRGEKCVCELVEAVDAERTSVSKHLAILKNTGIISDRREGVSIFYRLEVPCILRFLDCIDAVMESNVKKTEERIEK